jgi:hypothetical protein
VSRTPFVLEHDYAASYDLTAGMLAGVVVKEPWQFGPCTAYGYKAGDVPPDCPSAVTYRCSRIPTGDASDAAYAGCRSFSDPGCSRCCGIAPSGACAISTGQFDYGEEHACPCDCKPCAQCSFEQEREMRVTAAPSHSDCNCSLPPMGEPCNSWCSFVMYKNSTCPGL